MGNVAYLTHDNNKGAASATAITASSADTAYPAANLKVLPVAKHWRSTGVSSENLQFDLGSALAITLMAVLNHNLTSAATVTVNGGSTANPDGSQYTTTITWREFDMFKLLSAAAQTYRYWKVIFVDTANADGYIKVGKIMLGNATTLGFHWRYGSRFFDQYVNLNLKSAGGVPHVEQKYGIVRQQFDFGPLTTANMATIRTLYRALKGNAKPLFIIPESDGADGYFGRFINELDRNLNFREYASLVFEEDGRGRSIAA